MPIKLDEREYRSLPFEFRSENDNPDEEYRVKGYASTFDEYVLFSYNDVDYCERIEPTAFDEADMSDVIFLYNHEGMVYARRKNGTLSVSIDDHGLYSDADLSTTEMSRQMFEQIRSGLIDQMSFAFTVAEDDFEDGDGKCTRIIKKISKVYDVSAVSIPANPNTDISAISARNRFNGEIERIEAERLAREERTARIEKIKKLLEV